MFLVGQKQREMMNLCNEKLQLEIFGNMTVNMTWAKEPQNVADHCSNFIGGSYYLGPPNGEEKIDSLVGYMLAKIAEEVTDRDGSGWNSNDGTGLTVSSSCISPFQKMEVVIVLYFNLGLGCCVVMAMVLRFRVMVGFDLGNEDGVSGFGFVWAVEMVFLDSLGGSNGISEW
ncbi:hypothetical protein LWI28_022703 [Acer negundo]|uniref:Uncharacterized protein n=1 Tax=Acer negundo TaxID=4023 RepID=A0AAD5JL70_ACENE|nr:hypothetical protein LWI28_022703 [Acer negundo]